MDDKFKIDTGKVIEKVYHIKELHKILEDVIIDYVNQVVLMSDEELNYNREKWMKQFVDNNDEHDEERDYVYDTDIHSLAIWVEQLRRFKRISYTRKEGLREKNRKVIAPKIR